MKIDRSLFLVLTGSIAGASACHIYATTDPPPQPPPPATAGTVTTTGTTTPPPTTTAVRHLTVAQLHVFNTGTTPPPVVTPPPPPPACLDGNAAATAPTCTPNTSLPGCGLGGWAKQKCEGYRQYLKPKVAAAAVTCVDSLDPNSVCSNAQASYGCGTTAIKQACPETDPQWSSACGQIALTASCQVTAADCLAYYSGVNDAGKQKLTSCMTEGGPCAQHTMYSCVEGLTAAN